MERNSYLRLQKTEIELKARGAVRQRNYEAMVVRDLWFHLEKAELLVEIDGSSRWCSSSLE